MIKTFRTKRDSKDWARRTEDEMVRGIYIERAASERMLLSEAHLILAALFSGAMVVYGLYQGFTGAG